MKQQQWYRDTSGLRIRLPLVSYMLPSFVCRETERKNERTRERERKRGRECVCMQSFDKIVSVNKQTINLRFASGLKVC